MTPSFPSFVVVSWSRLQDARRLPITVSWFSDAFSAAYVSCWLRKISFNSVQVS
jgi:hypothetical protein